MLSYSAENYPWNTLIHFPYYWKTSIGMKKSHNLWLGITFWGSRFIFFYLSFHFCRMLTETPFFCCTIGERCWVPFSLLICHFIENSVFKLHVPLEKRWTCSQCRLSDMNGSSITAGVGKVKRISVSMESWKCFISPKYLSKQTVT